MRILASKFKSVMESRGVGDAANAAIVTDYGDGWIEVDTLHAAYPRAKPVPLLEKAKNFASAAVTHVAAGMPRCSDEQIEHRFSICQGCEHYDGKACMKCGCPVSRERTLIGKLAWADQSCPVGKWGPVSPGG
jgi:hypothetical protein